MARPYSLDLRERVVAAVTAGLSCRAVAAMFSIGAATVVRWAQRSRATGSPAALPMGGKRRFALAPQREWVLARVSEQPDLTLRALTAELAERGVAVSAYGVWHFLKREGISFKKSLHAAEQDRPDVARRRSQWRKYQGKLDPKRLVFVDETGAKTKAPRPT